MENNLVMASHLISALADLISEHGDLPVFVGDKDSINVMVPVTHTYCVQVSDPKNKPEKAIMIANFGLIDEDQCPECGGNIEE